MRILYLFLFSLAQAFVVNPAIASSSGSKQQKEQAVYQSANIAPSDSRVFSQGEQQITIQQNLLSQKTDTHRQINGNVSVNFSSVRKGISGIFSCQATYNTHWQNFLQQLLFPKHHFW